MSEQVPSVAASEAAPAEFPEHGRNFVWFIDGDAVGVVNSVAITFLRVLHQCFASDHSVLLQHTFEPSRQWTGRTTDFSDLSTIAAFLHLDLDLARFDSVFSRERICSEAVVQLEGHHFLKKFHRHVFSVSGFCIHAIVECQDSSSDFALVGLELASGVIGRVVHHSLLDVLLDLELLRLRFCFSGCR